MLDFDLQNHKPLREIVYDHLRHQILTGKISPRTRMMEVELAEEMGVSRTPVREAIRKLEKEGLVTIEPRRGAYVSDISVKDMLGIFDVREELEGFAASLAAKHITVEGRKTLEKLTEKYAEAIEKNDTENIIKYDETFHKTIVSFSDNSTLVKISEIVQDLALRFRYLYYDDFSTYKCMPAQHMSILEAISSGEENAARQQACQHVKHLKEFLINEEKTGFKRNTGSK